MEKTVVLQSDLKNRPPTENEQEEMDLRISKDEELFDPEPEGKKEEKKPEEKPEEKKGDEGLSDEKLLEAEEGSLTEEQKTRKSELSQAKEALNKEEEDNKLLDMKEDDLSDDQKTRKTELVKEKKLKEEEGSDAEKLEVEVKGYATEYDVSEEVARKDLESIGKIVENSKGNARLVAKQYLHLQRLQARTTEELKATKESRYAPKPVTVQAVMTAIEAGEFKDEKGGARTKEAFIEAYREKEKELTEDATDETVYKMAAKDIKLYIEDKQRGNLSELSGQAKEKRTKLISSIGDENKKFIPEIEPLLNRFSDRKVMGETFNLDDMVLWAKGKAYDADVAAADARGLKRGTEARKIVGEIKTPKDGKPKTKNLGKGKSSLSDAEKKRAEDYFANDDIPIETKYAHYQEILDHDKKLNEEKNKK